MTLKDISNNVVIFYYSFSNLNALNNIHKHINKFRKHQNCILWHIVICHNI